MARCVLFLVRYDGGAMEPQPPDKVWTYDDLVAMGDYTEGKKYEIVDGALVVSPGPSTRHQVILGNLAALLRAALQVPRIAQVLFSPIDVVLSSTRVVMPDFVVVSAARRSIIEKHAIVGAPDLVIEILSPSNRKHDQIVKRRMYARSGIREYWIVDPEVDSVEVLELVEGGLSYRQAGYYAADERVRSVVFEVELDVSEIFAAPAFDDPA
jgi:Uma2 family endonuclease